MLYYDAQAEDKLRSGKQNTSNINNQTIQSYVHASNIRIICIKGPSSGKNKTLSLLTHSLPSN